MVGHSFSDSRSELSRVARFPTAGQEERRHWVRGWWRTQTL